MSGRREDRIPPLESCEDGEIAFHIAADFFLGLWMQLKAIEVQVLDMPAIIEHLHRETTAPDEILQIQIIKKTLDLLPVYLPVRCLLRKGALIGP